jgi:hypothetical protein
VLVDGFGFLPGKKIGYAADREELVWLVNEFKKINVDGRVIC